MWPPGWPAAPSEGGQPCRDLARALGKGLPFKAEPATGLLITESRSFVPFVLLKVMTLKSFDASLDFGALTI